MPFGPNGEHVTVRLIDFDESRKNQFVVANQFTFARARRSASTSCCSSTGCRWSWARPRRPCDQR